VRRSYDLAMTMSGAMEVECETTEQGEAMVKQLLKTGVSINAFLANGVVRNVNVDVKLQGGGIVVPQLSVAKGKNGREG